MQVTFTYTVDTARWLDPNHSIVTTLEIVAFLLATWYAYVLVMGLYRAHLKVKFTGLKYLASLPALIFAMVLDCALQLTLANLAFLDPPRVRLSPFQVELLLTDRLQRYLRTSPGSSYRFRLARWICDHWLDPFDPAGFHCVKPEEMKGGV